MAWHLSRTMGRTNTRAHSNGSSSSTANPDMCLSMKAQVKRKVVLDTPLHTDEDGTVWVTNPRHWGERESAKPKNTGSEQSPTTLKSNLSEQSPLTLKSNLCRKAMGYSAVVIASGWQGVGVEACWQGVGVETNRKRPPHLGFVYASEDCHGFAIGTNNLNNYVSNVFSDLDMKQPDSERRRWDRYEKRLRPDRYDDDEEGPPRSKAKTFSFDSDEETPSSTQTDH